MFFSAESEADPLTMRFCLLLGFGVHALYFTCFVPSVNDAESQFLREIARRELRVLLAHPVDCLLHLGFFHLLPSRHRPYFILPYFKYGTLLSYHGFIPLMRLRFDGEPEGIRYGLICKMWLMSYFIVGLSLVFVFTGFFGLVHFDYKDEDSGIGPPDDVSGFALAYYELNDYGEIERVRMIPAPGLETMSQSQSPTVQGVLLAMHFWVWELQKILAFRWKTYLWFVLSELIDNVKEFVQNEYIYD